MCGRTLVKLLAQEPFPAGDALLGQLWTPHLDTHQRVLILDALSSAAHQMAHGPRALPEPPSRSPASLPDSSQDHPASDGSTSAVSGRAADGAVSPGVVSGAAGPGVVEGGNRAVKTRVWGHRSLARAGRSAPRSHKNRQALINTTTTRTRTCTCGPASSLRSEQSDDAVQLPFSWSGE